MRWQIATPQKKEFPPFVKYEELFSPPECVEIIRSGHVLGLSDGTIGNGKDSVPVVDQAYRKVQTAFMPPIDIDRKIDLRWLYKRLDERVQWTNRDYYEFDLVGFDEGIVFLKYEADDETPGHYKWHQDFGGGPSSLRKLSIVVQLSPPESYDGCELSIFTNQAFIPQGSTKQGDTIIFPSWTPHMVSDITRGTRYALAVWVAGPRFR